MDARVTEFQCIMPIGNIPSVMEHGILSHELSAKLQHTSVALQEVQDIRDAKQIPGGLRIHQYANLYFHARNPMLFKRKDKAETFCVLQASTTLLEQHGVVISDSNASSKYARFLSPSQWRLLDFDDIFAMDWRHSDQIAQWRHAARKCAELLVPHKVDPRFLFGARVVNGASEQKLKEIGFPLPITVDSGLYFR